MPPRCKLIAPGLVGPVGLVLGLMVGLDCAAAQAMPGCRAQSSPQQTTLVELYTSEGCNSCPPADRWLSSLKRRPDVLAAAFHVDYWDRLGWKDRFADPRYTQRQAEAQVRSGAKFSYTPQVLVNGRDWRRWPELLARPMPASVQIELQRQGDSRIDVRVVPASTAPPQLGLWWVLLEDDHVSAVKAGENAGVTLQHDHVVRAHGQRAPWRRDDSTAWTLELPPSDKDGPGARLSEQLGRKARLLVVVTDAGTGAPLQVVQLSC